MAGLSLIHVYASYSNEWEEKEFPGLQSPPPGRRDPASHLCALVVLCKADLREPEGVFVSCNKPISWLVNCFGEQQQDTPA